jgi:hypothetical protein
MKKTFALLLCIVLCFYFIPLPLSAAGMIQYKAIIETEPGAYVLENATSVSDAVYKEQCAGVVVYSLDVEDEPIEISDSFDGFHDKTVILSNVFFNGYIDCDELYLLGNAKMIVENENMEISGIFADGGNIPALEDEDLVDYDSLENKLQGAEKKYTITGNVDIDEPLHAYILEIKKDATLKIIPSEPSPEERYNNRIIVYHSLKVDGNFTAEEGQELEIKGGCAVEGITLFDSEGIEEFNFTENNNEIFEYNADIEKWVRQPGGDPGGPGGGDDPQNTYNLTLEYNPDGGHVRLRFDGQGHISAPPADHQVLEGSNVNVKIEPAQGYIIQEVRIDDGEPLIDETGKPVTEYIFENINANHTLSVTFVRPEYTITVTHSGNGQVEAQNELEGVADDSTVTYTVQQGENIRFRFIPDNGYMVSKILADRIDEEPWDEYEFNNVTADHILHVEFGKKGDGTMHTITVTVHGSGSVEADGLDNGSVQVEDMFDHMFTFRPAQGWHLESAIVDKGMISEMDMAYYGVRYNEDVDGSFFSLNLNEVSHDITLEITFESNNAEDITFKKYVVTADNNTSAEIAQALAREFGYINYTVVPEQITVEDESIDLSKINEVGYGTFNFSANIGGTTVEDQGYIVPTHEHILFEFYGFYDGEPVHEIRVLTPEDIEKMEFGVPAMDSGSIKVYGANGVRLEGIMSSDVRDAFVDGTRNEAILDEPFYRAEWHIANAVDMFGPEGLNIFGLNMIQDNAFCVEVAAASVGEGVQRTYEWDLNRYAQLTTGDYTSYVFFGNDIFTLRPPESGIGGLDSLVIETGDFPGYTISGDTDNQYIITFLSDFYDEITLDLLINGSAERKLTIHRVGVHIVEAEKGPDSNYGQVGHGTQQGTDITFNGENNYQLFATYYIPDFGDTAPYGLYVTYTWANGTTTTQIITEPVKDGNINTGPDFDGVFLDDVNDDFVSCCDYRLYSAPNKNAAPVKVNVIVLRDNPLDADTFGGVHFGSGSGVEWIRDD